MNSLYHTRSISATPNCNSIPCSSISSRLAVPPPASNSFVSSLLIRSFKRPYQSYTHLRSQSRSDPRSNDQEQEQDVEEDPDAQVQDLRVPDHWLDPSRALEV